MDAYSASPEATSPPTRELGRNIYTMPKTATVDLRLSKSFYLNRGNDRYRFEIFGEAFNLLNHQNITSVNTTAYCMTNGNPAAPSKLTSPVAKLCRRPVQATRRRTTTWLPTPISERTSTPTATR